MSKVLMLLLFVSSTRASAETKCKPPTYRSGPPVVETSSVLEMAVSTDLSNFSPMKLACLATVLKKRSAGKATIFILILSSRSAAQHYKGIPAFDLESPGSKLFSFQVYAIRHYLHGLYSYDQSKNEEYVLLKPLAGLGQSQADTRIDLPTSFVPRCAHEVAGRCLLEAEWLWYPDTHPKALRHGPSP